MRSATHGAQSTKEFGIMAFYIWHGEGQCDNKENDLAEARRIKQELIADGHSDAYITDEDNRVIADPVKMQLLTSSPP
jgi:hypothetical protein